MHRRTFLAALAATGAAGVAHANDPSRILLAQAIPAQRRSPDVIFVPTPNDVVYDLGCGDGRIVITAAQKYGARAVGVDIDPDRIKEATEKVRAAGVADRVTLIRGDIFDPSIKIQEASVVTLYLLQTLNEKLAPRLKSELKSGSRIVSHAFTMGNSWPAESSEQVEGTMIHLWRIP